METHSFVYELDWKCSIDSRRTKRNANETEQLNLCKNLGLKVRNKKLVKNERKNNNFDRKLQANKDESQQKKLLTLKEVCS